MSFSSKGRAFNLNLNQKVPSENEHVAGKRQSQDVGNLCVGLRIVFISEYEPLNVSIFAA